MRQDDHSGRVVPDGYRAAHGRFAVERGHVKPPPFRYDAPRSLDGAVARLGEVGDAGKVLAGGQSLIPLLNMRLAAPAVLVDVNGLSTLDSVEVDDRAVRVGATARHATLERDDGAAAALPLLRQAVRLVAHPVIRNRGTVVGSIVHADPAAELPAVLALVGGSVEVVSTEGSRSIPVSELFVGPLESSLRPTELATHVTFPRLPARTGTAVVELARRHGDYAMAGVATTVGLDGDRHVERARAVVFGVGPTPEVLDLTDAVAGAAADALDTDAAVAVVRDAIEPDDDIHATAAYRRHLAGVLLARALVASAGRATTTTET